MRWKRFVNKLGTRCSHRCKTEAHELIELLEEAACYSAQTEQLNHLEEALFATEKLGRKQIMQTAHEALTLLGHEDNPHAQGAPGAWRGGCTPAGR